MVIIGYIKTTAPYRISVSTSKYISTLHVKHEIEAGKCSCTKSASSWNIHLHRSDAYKQHIENARRLEFDHMRDHLVVKLNNPSPVGHFKTKK